ncbi:MAG: hypothetical protein U1E84_16855 [Rhodoferax sp.]
MTGTYVSAATPLAAELALRKTLARALRATSRALARAARALLVQPRPVASMPAVYEFYAEAGAPEGALYVDGVLVGTIPGVTRL